MKTENKSKSEVKGCGKWWIDEHDIKWNCFCMSVDNKYQRLCLECKSKLEVSK